MFRQLVFKLSLILLLFLTFFQLSFAVDYKSPIEDNIERFYPVISNHGMVSSQEKVASEIGAKILKQGGNAVDAAVAVGFALAVTLPKAGNLGGGGFMVIWLNDKKKAIAINYREKAPMAASKNMFLDKNGNVDTDLISGSYKASGVPGTVAGLILAEKKYGKLTLKEVMAPAIDLAKNGIIVTYELSDSLTDVSQWLLKSKETEKIFFKNGFPYQPGERLIQKDLANTLQLILDSDGKAFYQGKIAKKLVQDMKANNGLITLKDLKDYRAEILEPVKGKYKGYSIYSMPPPSSGGVILIELLNILSHFNLNQYGLNSAKAIHIMAEAMNYAFNDRNSDLGDPDFVKNPVEHLISPSYATSIAKKINLNKHTPAKEISNIKPIQTESKQTTHFSVIDADGNMVSNTYTLNYSYGNGYVAKGLGFLLNNEMDDFTAKVGEANSFGLIQGKANSIEPGKRPLSSMTPTVILSPNGHPFMATGSPGGSQIITTTLQVILNVLEYKLNVQNATSMPRIHSQLWPDHIQVEQGISPDTIEILQTMDHEVVLDGIIGDAQSVMYQDGRYYGAFDPRRPGADSVGDTVIK